MVSKSGIRLGFIASGIMSEALRANVEVAVVGKLTPAVFISPRTALTSLVLDFTKRSRVSAPCRDSSLCYEM